jgi:Ca2+-binding EF-hand superfamily protein
VIRWIWLAVFCLLLEAVPAFTNEGSGLVEAAARIREVFGRLDRNGDLQVDAEEFKQVRRPPGVGPRDFRLYDFDSNRRLSRGEFSCLSGLVEPPYRGTMPDPVNDLVDDAVAALDESYDHWDRRPNELVNAHTFVGNFLGSITPLGKRFVTGRIIDRADRNSDGKISRAEAKHFLEQQLGLRLDHGPPLRESTGRLVRYDRFLEMDRDQDGTLNRREFLEGWWKTSPAEQQFQSLDRDENGTVTYLEFADPISDIWMPN